MHRVTTTISCFVLENSSKYNGKTKFEVLRDLKSVIKKYYDENSYYFDIDGNMVMMSKQEDFFSEQIYEAYGRNMKAFQEFLKKYGIGYGYMFYIDSDPETNFVETGIVYFTNRGGLRVKKFYDSSLQNSFLENPYRPEQELKEFIRNNGKYFLKSLKLDRYITKKVYD